MRWFEPPPLLSRIFGPIVAGSHSILYDNNAIVTVGVFTRPPQPQAHAIAGAASSQLLICKPITSFLNSIGAASAGAARALRRCRRCRSWSNSFGQPVAMHPSSQPSQPCEDCVHQSVCTNNDINNNINSIAVGVSPTHKLIELTCHMTYVYTYSISRRRARRLWHLSDT